MILQKQTKIYAEIARFMGFKGNTTEELVELLIFEN